MLQIDTSLWDIKAKVMGVPLYQALGGKYRDKIYAYASQLHFSWGGQDLSDFAMRHATVYTVK